MRMRKLLALTLALSTYALGSSRADAQGLTRTTKGGYVACASLSDFNEQSELLASGDRAAWTAFLMQSSCVPLKAGVKVYVGSAKGLGVIKIRPVGSTVWFYTYTEATR